MILLPINLPSGFKPIVNVGDKIEKKSPIASGIDASQNLIVNLVELGIPQDKIKNSIIKNLGDSIKKDDILAILKGKFGMGSKKITSKYAGTIINIDYENGNVVIKPNEAEVSKKELFSPVDGVIDFCNNDKIVIKTSANCIIAKDAFGEDITGELLNLKNYNELNQEVEDKIVIIEKADKVFIYKALGLGALGIVAKDLEDFDFIDFSLKSIKNPIFELSDDNFDKIHKMQGKKALLSVGDKSIYIL